MPKHAIGKRAVTEVGMHGGVGSTVSGDKNVLGEPGGETGIYPYVPLAYYFECPSPIAF